MILEHPTFPTPDARHAADAADAGGGGAATAPVDACLPFSGMTVVPAAYDRFARAHFHRAPLRAVSWPDACPAYALAWLTHAAYGPELDVAGEQEIQLQWQDLQGTSNLQWREARAILRDAWAWLSRHEGAPSAPDASPGVSGDSPHAQH